MPTRDEELELREEARKLSAQHKATLSRADKLTAGLNEGNVRQQEYIAAMKAMEKALKHA